MVSLVYDTKDANYSLTLTAWIKGGLSLDVSTASIDRSDQTVTYNLTYALVDSLSYGTYEMVMSLMQTTSDYNDTKAKTLILFYEEPITITKVWVIPLKLYTRKIAYSNLSKDTLIVNTLHLAN